MPLLKIENISKSFGERRLFENLSLELETGKIYSLMGANGSGKTSLINIISGFIKPDRGKIIFDNIEILLKAPYQINKLGIARSFQDLRLINGLSVLDNLLVAMGNNKNRIPKFDEFVEAQEILKKISLNNFAKKMGGEISYGQQKLLTLGCCLANNPKLLLLDEPVAGIDQINKIKIKEIVLTLKNEGITVFQIEHDIEYIKDTSDVVFELKENGLKAININNLNKI